MIVYNCRQRSEEWYRLRLGIPTASEAHRIITPKGALSKQSESYMDRLLAEWAFGNPLEENDDYQSGWMARGSAMEQQAANAYEMVYDAELSKVGFVTNDNGLIGCSPDRLINADGILEMKVPSPRMHISYMRTGKLEDDYRPQLQMQLFIMKEERKYVDVVSYCPGFPSVVLRQEPDREFQICLQSALDAFLVRMLEARQYLYDRYPQIRERLEQLEVEAPNAR